MITMAIRWVNNYHRGFNRLWLVLSCLIAFAFVGLNVLDEAYMVQYPMYDGPDPYDIDPHYRDQYSRKHPTSTMTTDSGRQFSIQPPGYLRDRESVARRVIIVRVVDLIYKSGDDGLDKERILEDVQSMKEAKYFTTDDLKSLIDYKVTEKQNRISEEQEQEKIYQKRKWMAWGRIVRDSLGTFIVTFAFGHGVFVVAYWIIKGFRKD